MSKTVKSILNLFASLIEVVIQQIITLVVSRKVLSVYGSEINGVNAVFTNTLSWLLLIEGGFTFVSSVALFKAYSKNDFNKANGILSATKKAFNKIGILVGVGGVILAVIAPIFIKSSLSYSMLLYMFLLMAFGTFFGLAFTRKYELMFSVSQELYFKTYISIFISLISNFIIFIIISPTVSYIWVRIIFAIGVVMTGLLTFIIVKQKFPYVSYNEKPDMLAITGTRDMVFNKFVSLIRSSIPLFYIASFVGAAYSSVYAVYMIIFGFISKLSMMFINSVQNSMGQLIAEKNPEEVFKKFRIFEFLVISLAMLLLSISIPLTLPFIKFYTKNVHDVNYISWTYLILFSLITLVQVIHIPSGIVMLMSGEFKKSKKIQINSLIVLIIGIVLGGVLAKINGILIGILLSSIVLGVQEVVFTRKKYFKIKFKNFIVFLFILFLTSIILIFIEIKIIPDTLSFINIVYFAILLSILNSILISFIVFLFFKEIFNELLMLFKHIFKNNKFIKSYNVNQ